MIDSILSIVHDAFDLNRFQVLIVFEVDDHPMYYVTFFYGFFLKQNIISIKIDFRIIQNFKVNLVININFIVVLKIDIAKVISIVVVLNEENFFHAVNVVEDTFVIVVKEKQKIAKV